MAGWGCQWHVVMFCVLGWGMKQYSTGTTTPQRRCIQKVVTLEDKLAEKPVTGKEPEAIALRLSNALLLGAKGFRRTVHRFFNIGYLLWSIKQSIVFNLRIYSSTYIQ
ncbi:hypothetical protein AB2G02_26540 (plasmid) [Escherichia coli]